MLGGHHFKKKIDKRQRRKAARQELRRMANSKSGNKGHPEQQQQQQQQQRNKYNTNTGNTSTTQHSNVSLGLGSAKSKKNKTHSTLKGPVVTYPSGASRDIGNERNVNNSSIDRGSSKTTSGGKNNYYSNERYTDQNGSHTQIDLSSNRPRAMRASSAAQRRSVLKHRTDDDLLSHFREKLQSSTFRLLNEQIYSSPTSLVTQLLSDAETFADYHVGYKQQLAQWPINPNKLIIDCLLGDKRGKFMANKAKKLPGHIPLSWVIADMGCGDAQIAQALVPKNYTVHSFDLTSTNSFVTVANIASVPLPNQSVDVCIFSLSLMATDYELSLFEAFRILKPNRLLKIIEVRSRLPFPSKFAEMVSSIGFTLEYTDVVGDYFVAFDFVKKDGMEEANRNLPYSPGDVLVPSLYKKR